MGTVYRRKWKAKDGTIKEGKTYWIKYYENGKPRYEATRFTKYSDAKKLLSRREGNVAKGEPSGISYAKTTFNHLAQDYINYYRINNRNVGNAKRYVEKHLRPVFGRMKAIQITGAAITKYVKSRLEAGAENATINRELSALKRMFSLGKENDRIGRLPHISLLNENNVREGFFEDNEFLALREELPEHLKGVATVYILGWRRSEITGLTWGNVDLINRIVRLETKDTKSRMARTGPLNSELVEVFENQKKLHKRLGSKEPWVFLNSSGTDKLKRFDKAWESACKRAGIGNKLFHDLRRTAVRNMVRKGIPEIVAMKISGHKTRSVFDRYNIVSEGDLQDAARKLEPRAFPVRPARESERVEEVAEEKTNLLH